MACLVYSVTGASSSGAAHDVGVQALFCGVALTSAFNPRTDAA
jgi:hypothetical protein